MYGRSPNKGFQSISDARITATRCGCSSSPWMHTDPPLIGEMHCEHKLPHIPSFSSRFLQDPSGMFNNLGQWVKNGQWFADVCSTWLMTHVIAFLCVCVCSVFSLGVHAQRCSVCREPVGRGAERTRCTFLIVSMQLGFAMLEVGCVRQEHRMTVLDTWLSGHTTGRSLQDVGVM